MPVIFSRPFEVSVKVLWHILWQFLDRYQEQCHLESPDELWNDYTVRSSHFADPEHLLLPAVIWFSVSSKQPPAAGDSSIGADSAVQCGEVSVRELLPSKALFRVEAYSSVEQCEDKRLARFAHSLLHDLVVHVLEEVEGETAAASWAQAAASNSALVIAAELVKDGSELRTFPEKRGVKAGTFDRVKEAHRLLKEEHLKPRKAFKRAHTDSRTYYRYCERATGEEPISPYQD